MSWSEIYWNCLFSEYNSRRIYNCKILNVHMLDHKKDYIVTSILSANYNKSSKNLCFLIFFDSNSHTTCS